MALCRSLTAKSAMEYYFEKDPITNDSSNINTAWFGKCAELLELGERINSNDFGDLLNGQFRGETLVSGVNGHRAGIDFTFCAPKSVSLLCYHYGDREIEQLHHNSVVKTLEYLEKNLVEYRNTVDGVTYKVKSDNIIAGIFEHSTTRDNDPHLHSHATVLNITNTPNGFRAISNEKLFENQKLLTAIYHNHLAKELIEKGYQIDPLNSGYNIVGVSDEAIAKFSKRSKAISELLPELREKFPDLDDIALRDMANFDTRKDKESITAEELFAKWEKEMPRDKVYAPPPAPEHQTAISDDEMIRRAVDSLTSTEFAFTKESLVTTLLVQNVGKTSLEKCDELLAKAEKSKTVLQLDDKHYSTKDMIELEVSIVENVMQGKNTHKAYLSPSTAEKELESHKELTHGQKELTSHILTSSDRINIIQGDAGTGKTYAVECLRKIMAKTNPNIELLGLGFTGKAAQELGAAANIKTSTIASFLNSDVATKNKLLLVDEASMVSSADMKKLLDRAKDCRIVFIGDSKQIQAIGAGKMFKDLQRLDALHVIKMDESLRQKTEHMKSIVKSIKNFQESKNENGIMNAFEILKERNALTECVLIKDSRKLALEYYKAILTPDKSC